MIERLEIVLMISNRTALTRTLCSPLKRFRRIISPPSFTISVRICADRKKMS